MSLGSGPMSRQKWRPWEQCGWAFGVVAGSIAPLCLWAFSITWHIAEAVRSAKPKRQDED